MVCRVVWWKGTDGVRWGGRVGVWGGVGGEVGGGRCDASARDERSGGGVFFFFKAVKHVSYENEKKTTQRR